MEMSWSRWFRCESSFGLVLVPNQPGVYALAEEMEEMPEAPQARRTLAVFEVNEALDLGSALSRLFGAGSAWGNKLSNSRCYVRYAVAEDAIERRAAVGALRHWIETQRETSAQIFGFIPGYVPETAPLLSVLSMPAAKIEPDSELKTVAERAVDRVTRATEYAGVFPASI
jgi:hypothetical protein